MWPLASNCFEIKLIWTGLVCALEFWCNVKRLEYTVRLFLTYSLHFWSSEMPLDKIFDEITVTFIFAVDFNLTRKLRKMIFVSGFKNSKLNGESLKPIKCNKSIKSYNFTKLRAVLSRKSKPWSWTRRSGLQDTKFDPCTIYILVLKLWNYLILDEEGDKPFIKCFI